MERDLLTSSSFCPCATVGLRDPIPNPAFFIWLPAMFSPFKHSHDCICSTCPVKNDFIWRSVMNYMCKLYFKKIKKHFILKFDTDMNGEGISFLTVWPSYTIPAPSPAKVQLEKLASSLTFIAEFFSAAQLQLNSQDQNNTSGGRVLSDYSYWWNREYLQKIVILWRIEVTG